MRTNFIHRLPDCVFDLSFSDFLKEKELWRKHFEHIDFWFGKESERFPQPVWFDEAMRRGE